MSELLPIFKADNFSFEEDIPLHEEVPLVGGNMHDTFSLGFSQRGLAGISRDGRRIFTILAVNLPDMEMVTRLAKARTVQQVPVIKAYGQTDDLYAFMPEGKALRIYEGWEYKDPGYVSGSGTRILPD